MNISNRWIAIEAETATALVRQIIETTQHPVCQRGRHRTSVLPYHTQAEIVQVRTGGEIRTALGAQIVER